MELTTSEIHLLASLESPIKSRDVPAVLNLIAGHFGYGPEPRRYLNAAIECVLSGRNPCEAATVICVTDFDRRILNARFSAGAFRNSPRVFEQDLDLMAAGVPVSVATLLCFIANCLVPKDKESLVVTCIRNEGPWLLEWLSYYEVIGMPSALLIYNDNDDESEDLLKILESMGRVTLIKNSVAASTSPQRKAYNCSCILVPQVHEYQWVTFIDADEFLWPLVEGTTDFHQLLQDLDRLISSANEFGLEDVGAILVHWRWFTSKYKFTWERGGVLERFDESRPDMHVKAVVRPENVWSMGHVHYPQLAGFKKVVDSGGNEVPEPKAQLEPYRNVACQLNHYFSKSFEEFALKKLRGRPSKNKLEYDHFLWGSSGAARQILPNETIKRRTRECVERYLAIPNIAASAEKTFRAHQVQLEALSKQNDLRAVFRKLMGGP